MSLSLSCSRLAGSLFRFTEKNRRHRRMNARPPLFSAIIAAAIGRGLHNFCLNGISKCVQSLLCRAYIKALIRFIVRMIFLVFSRVCTNSLFGISIHHTILSSRLSCDVYASERNDFSGTSSEHNSNFKVFFLFPLIVVR